MSWLGTADTARKDNRDGNAMGTSASVENGDCQLSRDDFNLPSTVIGTNQDLYWSAAHLTIQDELLLAAGHIEYHLERLATPRALD